MAAGRTEGMAMAGTAAAGSGKGALEATLAGDLEPVAPVTARAVEGRAAVGSEATMAAGTRAEVLRAGSLGVAATAATAADGLVGWLVEAGMATGAVPEVVAQAAG